jgi:predicted GNAT superfamily acetyltransferase
MATGTHMSDVRIAYRDLTALDEFAAVVELERQIWGVGYGDVVPVPIFAITVKRGGILIGAFDGPRMIGFVYSLPGIRDGAPTQWSHMLGVVDEHRSSGLGRVLKLLQRERALAMGLDLVEWTYDPMQALNAHLNFAKLGVVVHEYEENIYGSSTSPLHRGNPTDRFVAEWWIRRPHVERRIALSGKRGGDGGLVVRTHEVAAAKPANRLVESGGWLECGDVDLSLTDRRIVVEIPTGFTEMLAQAPDAAMRWRLATREIFTTYFGRGYRAVDFTLDRGAGRGAYLLARSDANETESSG